MYKFLNKGVKIPYSFIGLFIKAFLLLIVAQNKRQFTAGKWKKSMVADAQENDEAFDDEGAVEGEEALGEEESGGFGPKQIVLFIVLPLLILVGVGAGLYFGGFIGGGDEAPVAAEEIMVDDKSTGIFYDLPDVIVNLSNTGRKPRFLKISISLELAKTEDTALIETVLPRVMDHFQTYLRELREPDLRGSAGIYRLRLELLARVNAAIYPEQVRDILFREILVQ